MVLLEESPSPNSVARALSTVSQKIPKNPQATIGIAAPFEIVKSSNRQIVPSEFLF
jgi:hypothetical protein